MASSNSSRTQFPFGDGTHIPSEGTEGGGADALNATTQVAMINIFTSCDTENTGLVVVSKLIDFIIPFMPNNKPELMELKQALDPENINPSISKETFFSVMAEWASKVTESPVEAGDDLTQSTSAHEKDETDRKELFCNQSTPRTSSGHQFLKGWDESSLFNVSTISSYSYEGQNKTDLTLLHSLQERIQELEHQNHKLSDKLDHVKGLLINSEEQNEQLHTDIDEISNKLFSVQKLNEQLQTDKKHTEELVESSTAAQKQIYKLEKLLMTAEKSMEEMKKNNQQLENEKQTLEIDIEKILKQKTQSKQAFLELQTELTQKDQEVSSLEEINGRLKYKLDEYQQTTKHYVGLNERLNTEKIKLEKYIREQLSRNNSPTNLRPLSAPIKSNKSGTFKYPSVSHNDSPPCSTSLSNISHRLKQFNSPKLLSMLKDPISPDFPSSSSNDDNTNISSGQSLNTSSLQSHQISTPKQQKTLLDETSPSVMHKSLTLIPVCKRSLSPCKESRRNSFSRHRFLGSESKTFLLECASRLYGNLLVNSDNKNDPNYTNANEDLLSHSPADQSLNETGKQTNENGPEKLVNTSFDTSNDSDVYNNMHVINVSAHESLESEISQVIRDNGFEKISSNGLGNLTVEADQSNDEITNHKETIEHLTKEIDHLKAQVEEYVSEAIKLKKIKEQYEELQLKAQNLQDVNSDKSAQIEKLTKEAVCLREVLEATKKKFGEVLIDTRKLVSERDSYKSELDDLLQREQQNRKTIESLKNLEIEYEALQQNFLLRHENEEKLNETLLDLTIENERALMENKKLNESLNQLTKEINHSECKSASARLSKHIEEQNTENANLSRNIEEKKQQISALKEMICQQNLKIRTLEIEKENALDRFHMQRTLIDKLEEDVNSKTNNIEQLDEEAAAFKQKIEDLEQNLLETCKEKELLESKYEAITRTTEELQSTLLSTQTEISKLHHCSKLNDQYVKTIADLEVTNQSFCVKNEQLLREIDAKNKEYAFLLQEKDTLCGEIQNFKKMKEQLHSKSTSTDSLQENLSCFSYCDAIVKSNKTDCVNCPSLKTQLRELNCKIQELEQRHCKTGSFEKLQIMIEKLKVRIEIAEQQLKSDKSKMRTLEATNTELQKELQQNMNYSTEERIQATSKQLALEEELTKTLNDLKQLKLEKEESTQARYFNENRCTELERKLDKVTNIHTGNFKLIQIKNAQLQEEIRELNTQKHDLEMKLKKTESHLQKLETKNLSIRKALTDVQSNKCEGCKNIVEDLSKEKDIELDGLLIQLRDCKKELLEYKIKLCDCSNHLALLTKHVFCVNENLRENRKQLKCSTFALYNKWSIALKEIVPLNSDLSRQLQCCEHTFEIKNTFDPLDEEMLKFTHQIHLTTSLFNILFLINIPNKPTNNVEVQVNLLVKPLHKLYNAFTLTHSDCPVNLDSPLGLSDPEGHVIDNCGYENEELLQDVQKDYFTSNATIIVASPSISNSLLEDLGLLEEGIWEQWPKEETEKKIAMLSTAFMVDISSVKERCQQQETVHNHIRNKLVSETENLMIILKTLKRMSKNQSLNKYLNVCIQSADLIICGLFQITSSATQCGALQEERLMLKCLNLVINHAAHLQKIVNTARPHQLKSTRSCRRKQTHNLTKSFTDIVSYETTLSDDSELTDQINTSDERNNFLDNFDDAYTFQTDEEEQTYHKKPKGRNSTRKSKSTESDSTSHNNWYWLGSFGLIILLIGYFIFPSTTLEYPWQWISLNDFFNKHMALTYPNGPPPT